MARTRDAELTGPVRRAEIISAAITLFAAHGYRGTSLAAVAQAAGISQSGLLHHFRSKEVLLTEVLAELDQQTLESAEVDHEYESRPWRARSISSMRSSPAISAIANSPNSRTSASSISTVRP